MQAELPHASWLFPDDCLAKQPQYLDMLPISDYFNVYTDMIWGLNSLSMLDRH